MIISILLTRARTFPSMTILGPASSSQSSRLSDARCGTNRVRARKDGGSRWPSPHRRRLGKPLGLVRIVLVVAVWTDDECQQDRWTPHPRLGGMIPEPNEG